MSFWVFKVMFLKSQVLRARSYVPGLKCQVPANADAAIHIASSKTLPGLSDAIFDAFLPLSAIRLTEK